MNMPVRMRRLRKSDSMRRLARGVNLSVDNFVYPLFVCPGKNIKKPIESMTDCFHFSPDKVVDEAKEVFELGIPAVLLFGSPETKDEMKKLIMTQVVKFWQRLLCPTQKQVPI